MNRSKYYMMTMENTKLGIPTLMGYPSLSESVRDTSPAMRYFRE